MHVKTAPSARAEAAGLIWLREASSYVVEVIEVTDSTLTLSKISSTTPTAATARVAGQELARIHNAGAPAYGSPPPGYDGPNYIGTQKQECTPTEDWNDFYAQQRVLPFARKAVSRGNLTPEGLEVVEQALSLIHLDPEAPARLHGDLWAGNLMFDSHGPVFIDPAAHGGHRETDLAMLALFGAPYLDEIYAGYEEVHPLQEGWQEMIPFHQLHPLAVHAVTHGPAYGQALVEAALRCRA